MAEWNKRKRIWQQWKLMKAEIGENGGIINGEMRRKKIISKISKMAGINGVSAKDVWNVKISMANQRSSSSLGNSSAMPNNENRRINESSVQKCGINAIERRRETNGGSNKWRAARVAWKLSSWQRMLKAQKRRSGGGRKWNIVKWLKWMAKISQRICGGSESNGNGVKIMKCSNENIQ